MLARCHQVKKEADRPGEAWTGGVLQDRAVLLGGLHAGLAWTVCRMLPSPRCLAGPPSLLCSDVHCASTQLFEEQSRLRSVGESLRSWALISNCSGLAQPLFTDTLPMCCKQALVCKHRVCLDGAGAPSTQALSCPASEFQVAATHIQPKLLSVVQEHVTAAYSRLER